MNTFDWIGFAGLLVALAGWLYTWYVDRKVKTQEIALNDLQIKKYKEEAESKKAIIEANVYRTPPTRSRVSGWRMKIYNKGKSTAKNIRIESEDIEKIDSHIKLYIPDELLPYPLLHPQTSFEIVMIVNSGHDRGRNQEREQILSL